MRLTRKQEGVNVFPCYKCKYVADKLAAYEDAEEQGRLVILPCKVGDTVYRVRQDHIIEETVSSIIMPTFYTKTPDGYRGWDVEWNEIGRTVFLTLEEAEAALKGEGEDV